MANKSALATVLGIAAGLVVLCVVVFLLAKFKQDYKYKKGKIVYTCVRTPLPDDHVQSTGQCQIQGRTDRNPSPFVSMAACETKCGTFYQCYPSGIAGNYCGKTAENISGAFANTLDECNANCNQFNPPPGPGTVSSGRYIIKSYNSIATPGSGAPTVAYLTTYFDCGRVNQTNQVYPLLDTNATDATADVWIYDQAAGTLKSNMRYTSRGVKYLAGTPPPTGTNPNCATQFYEYPDQDLYLSMVACTGSDSVPLIGIMVPLGTPASSCVAAVSNNLSKASNNAISVLPNTTNGIPVKPLIGETGYTTGWYLAMSKSLAGQIARHWAQAPPQEYVCLDSLFPRNGGNNPLPYTQPATYCRNVGTCYNYTFVPVVQV